MNDFGRLFEALAQARVEVILVGGVAARVHGSARLTEDVNFVYRRDPENRERLTRALQPLAPYLRGAPPDLPFIWDAATLSRRYNFTLTPALGALVLLAETPGGGRYEDLIGSSEVVELYGQSVRVLGLRRLIEVKRAAGRPKDLDAAAELEVLLQAEIERSP